MYIFDVDGMLIIGDGGGEATCKRCGGGEFGEKLFASKSAKEDRSIIHQAQNDRARIVLMSCSIHVVMIVNVEVRELPMTMGLYYPERGQCVETS